MDIEILIDGSVWLSSLKRLEQLVATTSRITSDLVFRFDHNSLTIAYSGVTVVIEGEGNGEGCVVVPDRALQPLIFDAQSYEGSVVRVRAANGRLRLGSLSFSCKEVRVNPAPILLPVNASLRDVLQVRYTYTRDEIDASGIDRQLEEAEGQLKQLIAKAAKVLAPLDVKAHESRQFVAILLATSAVDLLASTDDDITESDDESGDESPTP